jgi:tellurite methyltransferase
MNLLRLMRQNPETSVLDTRPMEAYELMHVVGASHLPASQIEARSAELPPKGCALFVIVEPGDVNVVTNSLQRLRYTDLQLFESSSELWRELQQASMCESGRRSRRMWKPNEFLRQCLTTIIDRHLPRERSAVKTALDLACGSGRDAVFLSASGWKVTAIDYLPTLLTRAKEMQELEQAPAMTLLDWDLSAKHKVLRLTELVMKFSIQY